MALPEPICIGCNKTPEELSEYIEMARSEGRGETPSEFVRRDEGTYNPENGHFLCTPCYVRAGQPSSPRGWRAP